MADFTADFEAGVNNDPVTTDAGEASATAWSSVFNTVTYSNTQARDTLSAKCADSDNGCCRWSISANDYYGRFYIYAPSMPDNSGGDCLQTLSADSQQAIITVYDEGTVRIRLAAGANVDSSSGLFTAATWIRFEYHLITNGSSGQFEVKVFDGDSTSPLETITSPGSWNTGNTANAITYGILGGNWNGDIYIDDVVANATDWPGPSSVPPQVLLPTADSVDGAWTDQAGGTSLAAAIDESSFDDGDYIRSELNPSTSGCRIKLAAGGDPHISTGHVINWRTGKIGSATINMTVKLYQGGGNSLGAGTLIATFNRNNVGALTTYQETLSGGEADSITDYTDLYLEFFADTA